MKGGKITNKIIQLKEKRVKLKKTEKLNKIVASPRVAGRRNI